ncbi:MAG: PilT/PilU family type 4a pilus ATPase [Planctomycetota bacterium]|nr:PilT/PilU family type 4a pilus ATPase [Planctomycetota bacterium]
MPKEVGFFLMGYEGIEQFFAMMEKLNASDLHLKVGSPPIFRVAGKVRSLDSSPLTNDTIRTLIYAILSEEQRRRFERELDLDFAHSMTGVGRFRVNVYRQRGSISVAARRVQTRIPSFEELHLEADVMRKVASLRQGLVIVAGATNTGKSTTLAAIIDHINETRRCHIVTIEDPIEYLHADKKSFVNQREVGIDVLNLKRALKMVVRQNPDVILIGEMRDAETVQTALTAAETGHLVFGTLHASSAAQTLERMIALFPPERENQIRAGLRFNLRFVICQILLPSIKEDIPLIPAQEILSINATAQKLILEKQDEKLAELMRASQDEGMQTFNQALAKLVRNGYISEEVASSHSSNPEQLRMLIKGIKLADEKRILGNK